MMKNISKNILLIKLPVVTAIFFCFFISLYSLVNAQETRTIILKIDENSSRKKSQLLSLENIQPAVSFHNFNDKSSNKLLANPKALELLNDIKKYYYIKVPVEKTQEELINIKSQLGILEAYESVHFKLEQDKTKINDPLYSSQWALPIIEAENAWNYSTGKGVVVGVIDTGIDYYHEDLKDQLWINLAEDLNKNMSFDNWLYSEEKNGINGDIDSIDNDNNGYIDDIIGFDFVDKTIMLVGDVQTPDGDPKDEHGHGTLVSSIISSKNNNNLGITGIAFDSKIMTLRAFDASGNNECKDVANAIVYAAMNGVDIINMSFGDTLSSPLLHTAIKFADAMGCILVASAGNSGTTEPHFPSDYLEVISVGGCDEKLRRVFNYGDKLDITAPGVNIYAADINNTYNKISGTSASAPIVSAVVALMREKNKNLTTEDVRNILAASATKTYNGWSQEFGAGIVNAFRAVQLALEHHKTNVSIIEPADNTVINLSHNDTIRIIGSTAATLFDSYLLRIRKSNSIKYTQADEKKWDTLITSQYTLKNNEELGRFFLKSLKLSDSLENYTISLLVTLKNGNVLETRNSLKFCSENNKFKINKLKVYQPFYYNRRINLINVQTNSQCKVETYYRKKNTDEAYKLYISDNIYTKNHIISLPDIEAEEEVEAYVIAILEGADTIRQDFSFKLSNDSFENYSFVKKKYELPKSYIYNKSINIHNNNSQQFIMNDLENNLNILNSKIYEYSANENNFKIIDSSKTPLITVDSGDSNGDEKQEILAGSYAQYNLFQVNSDSSSSNMHIFDNQIFSFPEGYWAEAMIDINGDNKKEIILSSDTKSEFLIYSYENGGYTQKLKKNINEFMKDVLYKEQENTNQQIKEYELQKGFALGDFDGDGNIELALTTKYNDYLLIIEIDANFNARLKDYLKLENYYHNAQSHHITSCDLDADGKQDIVYLYFGKLDDGEGSLAENEMWTYSVFKYSNNNKFEKIFEDDIYGVRIWGHNFPFYFRNGLTTGNINISPGDEVVISTFPNLYVLTWDVSTNSLKPIWNYPYSLTNKALISDVDNNGRQEVAFASFNNTVFYEFCPEYELGNEITNFTGYATSSSSANFTWKSNKKPNNNNNSNSDLYELWLIKTDELLDAKSKFKIFTTKDSNINITDLDANTRYTAYIKLATNENYFSHPVEIFTNKKIEAISVEYLESNNLLKVKFSGLLPYNIPAGCFAYKLDDTSVYNKNNNTYTPSSAVSLPGDSTVVLNLGKTKLPAGNYILTVYSFRDFYNNFSCSNIINFTIYNETSQNLFLRKLDFFEPNRIILQFSEPASNSTTNTPSNYKILPFGKIEAIHQLAPDIIEIYLNSSTLDGRGKDFLIVASNSIISNSGNIMTCSAGNTLGFTISSDNLTNVYVYPNPVKLSKVDEAYIGHITARATVEIKTLDGKILNTIEEFDANGGVNWNLKDSNGKKLDAGVYLIKVTDKTGSGKSNITKFAIVE